jgi:hypothetical protein
MDLLIAAPIADREASVIAPATARSGPVPASS